MQDIRNQAAEEGDTMGTTTATATTVKSQSPLQTDNPPPPTTPSTTTTASAVTTSQLPVAASEDTVQVSSGAAPVIHVPSTKVLTVKDPPCAMATIPTESSPTGVSLGEDQSLELVVPLVIEPPVQQHQPAARNGSGGVSPKESNISPRSVATPNVPSKSDASLSKTSFQNLLGQPPPPTGFDYSLRPRLSTGHHHLPPPPPPGHGMHMIPRIPVGSPVGQPPPHGPPFRVIPGGHAMGVGVHSRLPTCPPQVPPPLHVSSGAFRFVKPQHVVMPMAEASGQHHVHASGDPMMCYPEETEDEEDDGRDGAGTSFSEGRTYEDSHPPISYHGPRPPMRRGPATLRISKWVNPIPPDPDDGQQQAGEQELATKMLQIQSKRFYIDVKQNRRGRFMKIAEIGADGRRNQVFLALSTAAEFRDHLSLFSDFYANLGPPNPDTLPEDGKLKSETMVKDNRRYYLDLKENSRGRFLRVSQTIARGGPRCQIAIPAQGMIEFRDALQELLEEFGTDDGGYKGELPEGRHMRVENKNFYFDIGQNNRGIYMRISEVKTNFRTAITIPEKSWSRFRDIFADYVDKMKDGGEKGPSESNK
ncbi:uncharacterized protein Pur-alpha isoform X2 [Palaemon carinicauda]|uniref:uncharacterized protein Pur-alpha isoform X2 n=1 Tax=Palaemon carinicauda TaxID=392227 RepID=UPI0035B5B190